ncbi:MAG TPA: DUF6079 family protein, partial [Terriglobia bacterium]|nr:DUF6079 family protein [Terriglobia bacterium]
MPPLIKDYVEFRKVEYLRSITASSLNDCIRTFLPTDGLLELLSRILESISKKIGERSKSLQEPASILLTGGHGVGKSHLLSTLFNLISQKGAWTQGLNDPRVQSNIAAVREVDPLCIWIDLVEQTDVPLPELVLAKIDAEYQNRFSKQVIDPSVIPGIGTIKAHELITFNIAAERPILLVIDGLAKRAQNRDVGGLNADIEFLSFMGYSSKSARFFLIVAAHEDFFSPKSPLGIDSTLMAQTLENFKIEWIDRASVREIIGRHIFRKSPLQQQDVRKLHAFIKAKLPNFQYSENDFCDAYPFHPLIFDLAERIRSKVSTFSLLDFVCTVYPKVASHRAVSLVTIEDVFDRVEYELKNTPECQRLYAIYQEVAECAVPRLQDRHRLWGKMLLKATCLFTLADRNPSVRDLADALLLFEDSEGLSYNVVGVLLGQMENAVDQGFTTTDDRLDRTYRLGAADVQEELNKALSTIASQIPDADVRLAEILAAAAADIFPDWTLGRDLPKKTLREPPVLQAFWRGTERPGCLIFSERFFPARAHDPEEPGEIARLLQELPSVLEPFLPGQPAVADKPSRELDWLLWMEPIGLPPEVQATLKPARPTEVHWLPAQPSAEESASLKKALALRLTEKSASIDFAASDLNLLREETKSTTANLFRELYLFRGKIITETRTQSFNQGHLECRSLRSFVSYLFKPNLDQLYSLHPDFGGEQLSESHVLKITRGLFAAQDPTNQEVQRLAGKFALPLGLVSQTDGLYELNLTLTPPIFLTQVAQFLESLEPVEKPIASLYPMLHRSPFGLTQTSQQLIVAGLVADGQIELLDPSTKTTISRENFASLESLRDFTSFKRIPSHKDYPLEILTQWCRLVTGRQELSDISTSRGREAALGALQEWRRQWGQLAIPRRVEFLPNEFLTTQMWRKLTWTKHRFEKIAETIESVFAKETTLIQGMGKVIDLFSENVGLLEKASRDLVELSHFTQWMEHFLGARKYLLASERTQNPAIEEAREKLLLLLEAPHYLINGERRTEFDTTFREFNEQFIDYYATQHDQCVGPHGRFEQLVELESSRDLRNLQLLTALPLGDSSYLDLLDEWIADFRDHQCILPIRDLLLERPSCQCGFKLSHPLNMAQIVEDLKSFLQLGIAHHRQALNSYRAAIELRLAQTAGLKPATAEGIRAMLGED